MSRKFWEIENLILEDGVLQVAVIELTSNQNDIAPPVTIGGVVINGHPLKVRSNSERVERVTITFPKVTEFRAVPEQCSWPIYEDGRELIPCLLYEKSGQFFYGKDCPKGHQTFDDSLGWVNAENLQCYVVHSESFDVYVLSHQPPFTK